MEPISIDALPLSFRAFEVMNSVRLAQLLGDTIALPGGGWADPFNDEGDVDLGALVAQATGTAISANGTAGTLANLFNGVTVAGFTSGYYATDTSTDFSAGKDWGSGNTKIITKALVYGPSDAAIYYDGSNVAASVLLYLEGSNDNSAWTTLGSTASGTANAAIITINATTFAAYRYHRIRVPSTHSGSDKLLVEITFTEGGSQNFTYNASTDLYSPTPTASHSRVTGATPTVGLGSGTPANINDNTVGTTISWTGADISAASIAGRTLAKLDLGSLKTVSKIEAVGFSQSAGAAGYALYYSVDDVSYTKLGADIAGSSSATTTERTGPVSARYVAVVMAQVSFLSATVVLQDLNAYTAVPSAMMLQSVSKTALAQKDQALVVVQATPNESITLNTDLVCSVARDTGSDFQTVSLTQLAEGWYYGVADLRSKPSGTAMRVKVATANGKNIDVSGWAVDLSV